MSNNVTTICIAVWLGLLIGACLGWWMCEWSVRVEEKQLKAPESPELPAWITTLEPAPELPVATWITELEKELPTL